MYFSDIDSGAIAVCGESGKTAWLLYLALNRCADGYKVAYFDMDCGLNHERG